MYGYHFALSDLKLGYEDGRKIVVGEKLTVDEDPILYKRGLHASKQPLHACRYASGPVLCRVRLSGQVAHGSDQSVATERRVLWLFSATGLLHHFSRWCAAQVVHLWDAPDVVLEFLRTGNENLREEALAAAQTKVAVSVDFDEDLAARIAVRAATHVADTNVWSVVLFTAWATSKALGEYGSVLSVLSVDEPRRLIPLARAAWSIPKSLGGDMSVLSPVVTEGFQRLIPLARAGRLPTEIAF